MKTLGVITLILAIIGALNWGLIGFFNYNLVAALFGDMSGFTRTIYALVGLSGLYLIFASPWFARMSDRVERHEDVRHGHAAT